METITPAGGGGPAGVILMIGNWEEECCQSYRRDAGRRSASLRIPADPVSGLRVFGIMPGVRPSRRPVILSPMRRLGFRTGPSLIRCLHYSRDSGFCAVQYEYGCYASLACPEFGACPPSLWLNLPWISLFPVNPGGRCGFFRPIRSLIDRFWEFSGGLRISRASISSLLTKPESAGRVERNGCTEAGWSAI